MSVLRLGGDEFVIVLFDQPDQADTIAPTLKKIQDAIAQPVMIGGRELLITASMGLSTYPVDGTDTETCCAMRMPPCTAPRNLAAMVTSFIRAT